MSFVNASTPIEQQIGPGSPVPVGTTAVTSPVYPPQSLPFRLRSFSSEVYNLTPTSHLVRLLGVLLGDAGGEQLRKRGLVSRLQSTLGGSSFLCLDSFWGALFHLNRNTTEALPVNPLTGLTLNPYQDKAFPAVWNAAHQADANFRSRIFQFAQALSYGPSPLGIKKVSEAVLNCPVDLYETFHSVPANYQATIVPWRSITLAEQYNLHNILNVIKPACALIQINQGAGQTGNVITLSQAWADSSYWEVQATITPGPTSLYTVANTSRARYAYSAYQGESWELNSEITTITAQEWDFLGNVLTSPAFEHYIWPDGSFTNYTPNLSVVPGYLVELGRMAQSGVTSANPINNTQDLSNVIMDGMDLDQLSDLIQSYVSPTNPSYSSPTSDYWSTPPRLGTDPTQDVIQYSFKQPHLVNQFSFDVANFPHTASIWVQNVTSGNWLLVYSYTISTCSPVVFGDTSALLTAHLHPQHTGPNAWLPIQLRMNPAQIQNIQIRLQRFNGIGPFDAFGNLTPYSLGVNDFMANYVLDDSSMLPLGGSGVVTVAIDATTTLLDDQASYSAYIENPNTVINTANSTTSLILGANLTQGATYTSVTAQSAVTIVKGSSLVFNFQQVEVTSTVANSTTIPITSFSPDVTYTTGTTIGVSKSQWRCAPQVSTSSVVNFYVDTRNTSGPQVIDKFYIEPTHIGVTCNLYWTQDLPTGNGTASDQPIIVTETGVTAGTTGLVMGSTSSNVTIPTSQILMPNGPWWIGTTFTPPTYLTSYTLWSYGGNTLTVSGGNLTFTSALGDVLTLPNIIGQTTNNVVVGVLPPGYTSDLGSAPGGTIYLGLNGTSTTLIPNQPPNLSSTALVIGATSGNVGFTLGDFVLKGEVLFSASATGYMLNPEPYCYKGQYRFQDQRLTQNAYVRFDPNIIGTLTPFGFVGGTPNVLANLQWVPLVKDFILTKGLMSFRPTLATFWKFEMTNLVAEPFSVYLPQIPLQSQTFLSNASAPSTGSSTYQGGIPAGQAAVNAQIQGEPLFQTQATPTPAPDPRVASPTTTLVGNTPEISQALAGQFFNFGYVSTSQSPMMPVNDQGGVINYTSSTTNQNQQIAFFCGFYLVQGMRSNPAAQVDTQIYWERFVDQLNYIF